MRQLIIELAGKLVTLENEKKLLAEQQKELFEEYADKLDVKAFKAALRISKIKTSFAGSDTELDNILETLDCN
mgnify:CR=1 FL=1|tara:strand:+ start:108 stop:326 length:219 start_codon:yes stop_codon:yes gene_type:complete